MESSGPAKQDGRGLHRQGPQERGQRGPKKRRKGRKDTNHCTSAWSHEVWAGGKGAEEGGSQLNPFPEGLELADAGRCPGPQMPLCSLQPVCLFPDKIPS